MTGGGGGGGGGGGETVVFEGAEYTCIGVQVLYRMRERIVSACLEDKQKRLLWARIEKIQKNKN